MDKECNCYYLYKYFLLYRDPIQNHDAFFQKYMLNIKSILRKIRSSNQPYHIIKVVNNYELGLVLILMIQHYHSHILKFIKMHLLNYDIALSYKIRISKIVITVINNLNLNQIKVNILVCC